MTELSYKTNWNAMSDQAISNVIGAFVKQNRLDQNKSQKEIAKAASISRSTLSLLERGETVTLATLLQVLRVLDLLYVLEAFQTTTQVSPIQLAKLEREQRKRASNKKNVDTTESNW
ncbi:MAG: transcriptional regulator with XRE-family HTH domain [Pseudoalteromonas distincta]|jgi:transcriptional regulator with XRE-family HTH domain